MVLVGQTSACNEQVPPAAAYAAGGRGSYRSYRSLKGFITVSHLLGSVKASDHASSNSQFPFVDLQAQFSGIKDEIMAALQRVMESQHFVLGPEVAEFEAEVARSLGTDAAISCASGSDALLLGLL